MVKLIRKTAHTLGILTFFLILLTGLEPTALFEAEFLFPALLKAACGLALFSIGGILLSDIVYKSIVNEVQEDKFEQIEGGLLQRFMDAKGSEMIGTVSQERPVAEVTPDNAAGKPLPPKGA